MKITKAMGRACLEDAERALELRARFGANASWKALDELTGMWAHCEMWTVDEFAIALAMCAAIAGVKP